MKTDPIILEELIKIDKLINAAKYKLALDKSESLYKKFPKNIAVQERYATMLADYAQYENPKDKSALKKKAVKILKRLTLSLKGVPEDEAGDIRNEYYHHSGQYLKQYKLGVKLVKRGFESFYFSQGAGASWHAYELAKKRQRKRSKQWAKVSIDAWEKYIRRDPDYYYPHVNLAFAFGIIGHLDKMEIHLKKAKELSRKPNSYFEFENTRNKIKSLHSGK